jgi:predicted hydrolase (HD superfamily)
MEKGAIEFGIPLWEHCQNVIIAMRQIAPELGLVGTLIATS